MNINDCLFLSGENLVIDCSCRSAAIQLPARARLQPRVQPEIQAWCHGASARYSFREMHAELSEKDNHVHPRGNFPLFLELQLERQRDFRVVAGTSGTSGPPSGPSSAVPACPVLIPAAAARHCADQTQKD